MDLSSRPVALVSRPEVRWRRCQGVVAAARGNKPIMSFLTIRFFGTTLETRDYLPFLRWLLLTVVTLFGFWSAWRFGYIQLMIGNDRSHITIVILGLYATFSLHLHGINVGYFARH